MSTTEAIHFTATTSTSARPSRDQLKGFELLGSRYFVSLDGLISKLKANRSRTARK